MNRRYCYQAGMRNREVEVGAELIHIIQTRLPVEEAARTSVLSKSWLQAWSTIPTLRFRVRKDQKRKNMKLEDVDRTLTRYLRDNIPIETFELMILIENQESASHAENLILSMATKTCLKEFSLVAFLDPDLEILFTVPDEILLCEHLTKIRVGGPRGGVHAVRMMTSHVINCVYLREVHLDGVDISEEAFNSILSSCSLLVKIELLDSCKGFKTIKVKNLARLSELTIMLDDWRSPALEISDVPNLGLFRYHQTIVGRQRRDPLPFNAKAHSISLGSSVTKLELGGVIADNACLDMIKSGFPVLEKLTLHLSTWIFESFHFTCASIKSLSLLSCPRMLTNVQVHAPKLLVFWFGGSDVLPNLLFPVSSLEIIKVSLQVSLPVDASFFIKMREALTLSRKCNLRITTYNYTKLPFDIDIDDLRTKLMFPPAMNVQKLSFKTIGDECLWERSPFIDAFFEICHPKCVYSLPDVRFRPKNHFGRVMLKEVLEKKATTETVYWPQYLKHVAICLRFDQNWETLTSSHRSFLDGSAPSVSMGFKLTWR